MALKGVFKGTLPLLSTRSVLFYSRQIDGLLCTNLPIWDGPCLCQSRLVCKQLLVAHWGCWLKKGLWVCLNLAICDSHPLTTLLTIFISFLSDNSEYMLFQWRMSWLKWLCDWLNVVTRTFKLIFPGENRLVEFLKSFHQIHSCSDIKLLVMWPTDFS